MNLGTVNCQHSEVGRLYTWPCSDAEGLQPVNRLKGNY